MAKILIKNVRLSFPSLFQMGTYAGQSTGKYEATFLISKQDKDTIAQLKAAAADVAKEKWGDGTRLKTLRFPFKDGDESGYEGYEGCISLKCSTKHRPVCVDRARRPVTEDDELFYPGCYVNAQIDFWAQDNQWGKRINANFYGVQFFKDGDDLGSSSGAGDVTSGFDVYEDEPAQAKPEPASAFDDDDDGIPF